MSTDTALLIDKQGSTTDKWARRAVVRLLNGLEQGYVTLSEQGQVIGHFGSEKSDLKAEINVLKPEFYRKLLLGGSIASGETFIDQAWETPDLTKVIQLFARNLPALDAFEAKFRWLVMPWQKFQHWRRRNHKQQAKENISAHYDLGNELYQNFLDPAMQYSSAVYQTPEASLSEAQQYKLKRLCDSLDLQPDDHLLEIGTGWGGLAIYAAQHYGCKVTTTTISAEQFDYAQQRVEAAGLSQRITLLKEDYRDLQGQYDKLISVEMIEAVGRQYMATYFETCSRLLKPHGKMALQAITIADQRMPSYANSVDFIQQHVFPGGFLPSLTLVAEMFTKHTDMVVRHVQDIGFDYAKTLRDWRLAFNQAYPNLDQASYDDKFWRLWNFYLCYCEGGFLERSVSAMQLVATKPACR
ncbi:Tuberculostearic acid methyltransferase UfaA1 [Pseudidiomarina piscicola]|uniref:Tuberculostearic acid methyltransferase UfaA1 n=1 Tax=Pseudidiomarina piscicola TaxID=2614830 RepID=A0A6S6WTP8_9GAMM|nr:cyclopropane-fatty-acyl-phospholipid synthase family protein [Pseudidiomarina piscicola]CAB0150099.1 Tuberculostearic acid methyltransferase UfaA1 [Pseudidiomarina piscicola]VZT39540.1 Tuberculostearic acid methyltransferase UfaA1 [Pseudomonas aeruginosa]